MRLASVGTGRVLLDADVVLAPLDDPSTAVLIDRWLGRCAPLVVGPVPVLVRLAGVGGDAEHVVAPLAGVGRLLLDELVKPLAALHEPCQVGDLARLLLLGRGAEHEVDLALLDVNRLGIGADGGGREPDTVLWSALIEVVILQEGVSLAAVGNLPALAITTLGLGLSRAPDLLASSDKPLASSLLARLLRGVEAEPVRDLAQVGVLVPVRLLGVCQVTVCCFGCCHGWLLSCVLA